jgi:hypothetical protein
LELGVDAKVDIVLINTKQTRHMKTAIEWLIDMLVTENEVTLKGENFKLFEMAKAMEKEQIIDAFQTGDCRLNADEYYNETFKQDI